MTVQTNKIFVGFSTVDSRVPETRLYDIELIKRDIKNHFMTKKGERVMRPNYGSNIWEYLFEPFTADLRDLIKADVQNVLNSEPRVDLVDLQIIEQTYGIEITAILNYKPFNVTDGLFLRYIRDNFANNNEQTNQFADNIQE